VRIFINRVLNGGITEHTSFEERVRLRSMNQGLVLGIVVLALCIAITFPYLHFALNLTVLLFVLIGVLALNVAGRIRLARNATFFSVFVWLLQAAAGFGPRLGIENFLFVLLMAILLFEGNRQWKYLSAATIAVGLGGIRLYYEYGKQFYDLPDYVPQLYVFNTLFTCLLITLMCRRMLQETKANQDEVLARKKVLAEANEMKDRLFSVIAHDIRSPINNLSGILSLLQNDLLTREEQAEIFRELQEKIDQSGDTLSSLLEWASLHFNKPSPATESRSSIVSIADSANQLSVFYKKELAAKRIHFINKADPNLQLEADIDQIQFVLRNLVGNAIKFSHTDGSAYIEVATQIMAHGDLAITVTDNGLGMTADKAAELFSTSRKISTLGTANEKGAGLGLQFCKDFVTLHGGQLSVASATGQGSVFTVLLPASLVME
jgi:signal transduction histidine kinase